MKVNPAQLTLDFFGEPEPEPEPTPAPIQEVNGRTLADYAFLYTCTEKGHNSGIHFMMTTEEAQKWCCSDLSKGVMMGTQWDYFWTSVKNFVGCYWNLAENAIIDLRKHKDNGRWDAKIASLGLHKYSYSEMRDVLKPFGITVLFTP